MLKKKISAVNEPEISENSVKPVMELVGFQKRTAKIIVQSIYYSDSGNYT